MDTGQVFSLVLRVHRMRRMMSAAVRDRRLTVRFVSHRRLLEHVMEDSLPFRAERTGWVFGWMNLWQEA